jgi:hypothetical protein
MLHVVICSSLTLVGFIQAPAAEQGAADREPVPLAALECAVPDEIVAGELDMDLWSVRLSEGDLDLRMAAYEAIVGAGGGTGGCSTAWGIGRRIRRAPSWRGRRAWLFESSSGRRRLRWIPGSSAPRPWTGCAMLRSGNRG